MSYSASKSARQFLKEIANKGKDESLRPPSYRPPGESLLKVLITLSLVAAIPGFYYSWIIGVGFLVLGFIFFGILDWFVQDDHSIVRIYGPMGRARYIVEDLVRDKYLQYFNENNTNGRPIPKIVRDYIYQRAHGLKSISSFGTELDNLDEDNTVSARVLHRNFRPENNSKSTSFGVEVGASREGIRPYVVPNAVNISAMSYGSLNYRACEAMSIGSKNVCYLNTGEGGYGPHGIAGNDVVFQIGTGKFGVGDTISRGNGIQQRVLNDQLLRELVRENDNIRMVEVKISQGAKPGKGGQLPGAKVTPEIAAVRKVEPYKPVISPAQHTELAASTNVGVIRNLMDFIEHIRQLTQLPVGIKICFGDLTEMDLLVEAMRDTGKGPDYIQIDGADGGTGAAPNIFLNYVGYGTGIETLGMLDLKLKKAGIRDQVALAASGRIFTPAHATLAFAYGADWVMTARGAMLALGCIQALKCHTGHCPTGITTHNKWRMRGLVVPEKSTRIHEYFSGFHKELLDLTQVLGYSDPRDIQLTDLRIIDKSNYFRSHFTDKEQVAMASANYSQ